MEDISAFMKNCGIDVKSLATLPVKFSTHDIRPGEAKFRRKADPFLRDSPSVTFNKNLGKCTLVCVDPDAPERNGDGSTPGQFGPWLHWFVVDCTEGDVATGRELVEYMAPVPPKGMHRYIFVLFQQKANVTDYPTGTERKQWNFRRFIQENSESLKPVAANYFYCSPE